MWAGPDSPNRPGDCDTLRQYAKCVSGVRVHWYSFEVGVLNFNQILKRVHDQKRNSSGRQNHVLTLKL